MRPLLLTFAALAISAPSQPAQQQAQLPPVIKVEMPPTKPPNLWIHLAELIVPGIIGGGLALFGGWLATKYNRALNATNHEYEVERWERQMRWTAKKERYEALTAELYNLSSLLLRFRGAK